MPTISVCYTLQSVPENINIKKKYFTTNHFVSVQYTKNISDVLYHASNLRHQYQPQHYTFICRNQIYCNFGTLFFNTTGSMPLSGKLLVPEGINQPSSPVLRYWPE